MENQTGKAPRAGRTVIIRETVIGDGVPKICVPLVAASLEELKDALEELERAPFDLAEWRADFYSGCENPEQMRQALSLIRERLGRKPLLFTFRTAQEGGARPIQWEQYAALNRAAAGTGLVDLVDVEINRGRERVRGLIGALQELGVSVVASSHDFEKTPKTEQMRETLEEMQRMGADICKLAVMPKSRADVLRLLEVSVSMRERYGDRPFITMAMGAMGAISRIGAGFDGSAVTFGTAGRSSAPGQIPAEDLARCLQILSEGVE